MSLVKSRDNYDKLKAIKLFENIDPEFIQTFLKDSREKNLMVGDILLSPQKHNEHVYILLSGKLEVHLDSLENPALSSVRVGECVGEISIIDTLSPSAYVVATEDSEVLELNKGTIWDMINGSHTLAKNLLYILSSRIRYGNGIISDHLEAQKELQHIAMVDSLTGLYNRHWFNDIFKRQLAHCLLGSLKLSLILLDIDHFKSFNDRFGHLVGDIVLKKISEAMLTSLRSSDTLARFGGEEFIVLLPETHLPKSLAIAENIRKSISRLALKDDENNALPKVTVSLGIGQLTIGDSETSLIKKADDALYKAKNQGRNRVQVF
ncbi:MAG: GGDEF domain-containing protein [Methylococcales bacterium]|nr:GGDEF domain-containing protein [Methylococcales bacterium]